MRSACSFVLPFKPNEVIGNLSIKERKLKFENCSKKRSNQKECVTKLLSMLLST